MLDFRRVRSWLSQIDVRSPYVGYYLSPPYYGLKAKRLDMRRSAIIGFDSVLLGGCGILGPDTETRISDLPTIVPEDATLAVPDPVAAGDEF